ncbi:MAG: ABC transporter permease, partial [Caldilineaceae bacterium]|nr:ABC transporter permease [Caldilineaceae bacterium]
IMAQHEYVRLGRRRSFLLSTLGVPLLIALAMGLGFLLGANNEATTLGYVDQAQILNVTAQPQDDFATSMIAFDTADAARAALESDQIDAYYVVPADYARGGQVQLVYVDEAPSRSAQGDFRRWLRAGLVQDLSSATQARLVNGSELAVRSADGSRSLSTNPIIAFLLPFLAAMLFIVAVMTSAGYLLQVVAEEKENRTMEMLVTTMRPIDLIAGKALGLMGLALTQIAIWSVAIVVAVMVGGRFWPFLQGISVPWQLIGVVLIFFLPSYALVAGMMTAVGAAVTEVRQGQQVAGMFNMLFVLPLFVLPALIEAPESAVATGLTLFPSTAFITVTLRWALGTIPAWQMLASWLILVASATGTIWLATKIFRAGMLRYGQALTLKGIVATLQGR